MRAERGPVTYLATATTLLRSFVVKKLAKGDKVTVTCKGKGCRTKRVSKTFGKAKASYDFRRALRRNRPGPGAVIEVRVTHAGRLGARVALHVPLLQGPEAQGGSLPATGGLQGQALPMTGAQAATVAGIAAVALGLGYGVASMGGRRLASAGEEGRGGRRAPRGDAVGEGAGRGARRGARRCPRPSGRARGPPVPAKTPAPGATPAPTAAPTAAPTSAPTSAPTAAPTPARTPDTGTIG